VGYWRPGGFAVSMKVFVTGAAGFSGFHVARALLAREDEGWGSIM
jgi:nucleoside-diphosphate-sugar epimerase